MIYLLDVAKIVTIPLIPKALGLPRAICYSGLHFGPCKIRYSEEPMQASLPSRSITAFDDAITRSLERTAVVKITLTEPPTGKRKQYDKEGEEMTYGRME